MQKTKAKKKKKKRARNRNNMNVDIHGNSKLNQKKRKRKRKRKRDIPNTLSQEKAPMQANPSARVKPKPTTFLPPALVPGEGAEVFVELFELLDGAFACGGAEAGDLAPNNSSGNNTLSTW